MHKRCATVFAWVLLLHVVGGRDELGIKLTNIECKSLDPEFVVFKQCRMKAVSRDITEVSVHLTLLQLPVNNITVSAKVVRTGFEHKRPLLQYSIDACAFFRNKKRNFIAELTYKIMGFDKYSNMNHSCPYTESELKLEKYRFNGYIVSRMMSLPAANYKLITMWAAYNVQRVEATVYFNYA